MKTVLAFIFIFIFLFKVSAQDKISVSKSTSSTFIETYKTSFMGDDFVLDEAYRLGPASLKILREGIKTSLKWIELNKDHQKTFQKEICRFKVMEKERYEFHGYVDEFADEMTLIFNGESDEIFKIEIKKYNGYSSFIIIEDTTMLNGFKNLLDGKSANNEIDDIFKN